MINEKYDAEIIAAAKKYTKAGLPIFPTKPGSKEPDTVHGFKDATNDFNKFMQMHRPGDGIAMPTGASTYIIIDPDVAKDENKKPIKKDGKVIRIGLDNLCKQFNLLGLEDSKLQTLVTETQSGGDHFWFRNPKGKPPLKKMQGNENNGIDKVDIQAEGAYVVLPPTEGKFGKYKFITDVPFDEIPEMPLEFYNFFAGTEKKSENDADLIEYGGEYHPSNFKFDNEKTPLLISTIADITKRSNTGIGAEMTMYITGTLAFHNFEEPHALAVLKKVANINGYEKTDWIPIVKDTYKKFGTKDKNGNQHKIRGFPWLKKLLAEHKEFWNNYDEIIKNLEILFPENLYDIAERMLNLARVGPAKVVSIILETEHVVTKSDNTTDLEEIYLYHDGFYARGEEELKIESARIYTDAWNKALELANKLAPKTDELSPDTTKAIFEIRESMKKVIERGPTRSQINETLAQLRLATYTNPDKFNPDSHIPFLNGYLNTKTWKLEPHNPDLIYLWRIEANLNADKLDVVRLQDSPKFSKFINETFEDRDIPLILQYFGYTMYPDFPRQMVLFMTGRERVGKGSLVRILKKMNPYGYGSISFEKLIMNDNRFAFQGIEGKNLLVDTEIMRYHRRGQTIDYRNINKLFGGDVIDLEKKGVTPTDYISKAKGIFLGNLPLPKVTDEPFLARVILVKTKDHKIEQGERIANIEDVILSEERDTIATLLVHHLMELSANNWNFTNEMTTDETVELWNLLSDIVEFYTDDEIDDVPEMEIPVNTVYDSFKRWSKAKGIPLMAQQTFTKYFGKNYIKKRIRGENKERIYVFTGCSFHKGNGEIENNIKDTDSGPDDGNISTPSLKPEYKIENLPEGPVKQEFIERHEDLQNEKLKSHEKHLNSTESQEKVLNNNTHNECKNTEKVEKILFYKTKKEYNNTVMDAFKRGDYFYYKISTLEINDGSKEWISWVTTADSILEATFTALKNAKGSQVMPRE